jgi:DNA mismatch repair protein MutS2
VSGALNHTLEKLEFDKIRQRVVRYAASDAGRQSAAAMAPSFSASEVRAELSKVSELKRLLEEEGELPLSGIHDVAAAINKSAVEGAQLLGPDLSRISSTLRAARLTKTFIAKRRDHFPLLWTIAEQLHTDKVLEYNIDQAIDDSGAVRATASRELQTIRRSIAERYDQLRKRLEGILKNVSDLGFSQDDIITTREGRMVIPVKVEHKYHVPGFIHSASASGATVFIEPTETLELNNDIRSLHFQEQREVDRILKALMLQVRELRDPLLVNTLVLSQIDLLHAKAKYSIEILGVEPVVHDRGPIRLRQARHPVLLMTHGLTGTVPLDLDLGDSYNTLVISGPNAGGKSVALKAVGLLVLMAQAGLHIPASAESSLRIVRSFFVDIGDEQSIENDLSTFSSHLENLKEIAGKADEATLVLIDEIGTGTDPAEGGAIAAAMLEHLTRRGALTIATTHHGALKVFAHETEGIENGAMEFDQDTLSPTYRFKGGIPGSSYALEMAARLGFSESMLERSRRLLGNQQTKLENLIVELEATTQRHRKDLAELLSEKERVDELVARYESKIASQAKELKEVKRKALEEAEQIIQKANAAIEHTVKEIREGGAEKKVVQEARRQVGILKDEITKSHAEVSRPEAEETRHPTIGNTVKIRGSAESGEVENVSADGRTALVAFGSVKMKVPLLDLVFAERTSEPAKQEFVQSRERLAELTQGLDLRGMTGEEAIPLVDKFLDDAFLAGLHRVDIIHGKGTGALGKKVREFLAQHPRVRSYHIAEWNEGGTGATVVELKES